MTCDGCYFDFHIKCAKVSPIDYTDFNQLADPRWQCLTCADPFMFTDSFFSNATNSTHSEIDTTDISACTDSDADTSSNDYTSTNISTNSGDELCGIEALPIIRKQNREM